MQSRVRRILRLCLLGLVVLFCWTRVYAEDTSVININSASEQELQALHGIGPVIAKRIVEYRITNGPFRSIEEIINVKGIGKGKLAAIRDRITVILDINRATSHQLRAYGFKNIDEIMAYRAQYGRFNKLDELLKLPSTDEAHYRKIKPLLTLTP